METLNNLTWGTWTAIIALFIAIASPVCTALITNRHQRKMREFDEYTVRKYNAMQNYLSAASAYLALTSQENCSAYGLARGGVILFISQPLLKKLNDFDSLVSFSEFNSARILFVSIADDFNAIGLDANRSILFRLFRLFRKKQKVH